MAYEVFISYASVDKRAARELCSELENAGLLTWIAPRDIPSGADYAATLYLALERASALLLVFSRHTGDSPHVLREVEQAKARGIPIFPIRTDRSLPSGPLGVLVGTLQWTDDTAFRSDNLPEALALAAQLTRATAEPMAARASMRPSSHRAHNLRVWFAVSMIGLIAAIGVLFYFGSLRHQKVPESTTQNRARLPKVW